ncbi:MAG: sulfotransferase [Bacteroidales bacterium]
MEQLADIQKIESMPMFFILARPRTGSSLLRLLFDAHPRIQIPIEAPVILDMYSRFGKIKKWTKDSIDAFYKDLFKLRRFSEWIIDTEKLKKELYLCEGVNSFQSLCKVVHLNYISAFEKSEIELIGDKNPHYSLQPEQLLKLFPNARFIHLTRDYRDHYLSMRRADFYESRLSLIIHNWRLSERKIEKIKLRNPKAFLTLRYEDLVLNPEVEMRKVMDFLDCEFLIEILDFHKQEDRLRKIYSADYLSKYFGSLLKPITAEKVGEWKIQMSDKEVEIADFIVGKYAEKAGYQRKYLKRGLRLWIYILPRVCVIHSYNLYLGFLKLLPSFAVKKIKKTVPGPVRFYAKIFSN